MQIIISNHSDYPIYKQIVDQIKELILRGILIGGDNMPSIRTLAKDLKISNITTKRAYEELLKEEFIESNSTKGYFVKNKNKTLMREEILLKIEKHLLEAIDIAKIYEVSGLELKKMLENIYEEDLKNEK